MKRKAAIFCNSPGNVSNVYGKGRREQLAVLTILHPKIISLDAFEYALPSLAGLEVIFSTWGMLALAIDQIARLPELRAVFYGAGSVQGFARPFLESGVQVVSAWGANAVPVAEFTLAQILLGCKGYFCNTRDCDDSSRRGSAFRGPGIFDECVGVLGAGMIGRKVVEFLKLFDLKVLVFDPFLTEAQAGELGVEKVEKMVEVFERAFVVTNHCSIPSRLGCLRQWPESHPCSPRCVFWRSWHASHPRRGQTIRMMASAEATAVEAWRHEGRSFVFSRISRKRQGAPSRYSPAIPVM
ncbi:MAG: hypothetical protein KAI66_14120 [Lentisphaeria bacterium]|nr:hypothetical protein [Lentisphaeria bacterium]